MAAGFIGGLLCLTCLQQGTQWLCMK